jgi:hypothetical protein
MKAVMYSNELEKSEVVNRDRVYVSWTEHWPIEKYVVHYLRSRKLATDDESQAAVRRCIESHPGHSAYRKLEMDFYLDSILATNATHRSR